MMVMTRIDCTHGHGGRMFFAVRAQRPRRRTIVMFVVAGVSGNTGSVVANTLLSERCKVRVLVRDASKGAVWKAKGADVVVVDLHGPEEVLASAFAGAEGAYVLLPPLMRDDFLEVNARTVRALTSGLKAARVPHTVLLSSIGAQHAAGTGPILTVHRAENEIRAAGLDATFVRAAYFMDNFANGLQTAATDGVLPAFGDTAYAFPMIATDDIGRTAARALLSPRKGQRVINLSHSQDYSANDAAAAFGRALGRPVKTARVPDDRIADALVGYGIPRGNAAAMQEMVIGASRGLLAFEPSGETVHGTVSIDAFATRLVWSRQK
jgi:uncharacterized protein YbjT (DUF2867 family)